jgi:cell division GTPase FtsZ
MSKTMILAIGGAGCNMAETIMRVANAHWVKEATYLFADSDMERLSELGKKGFETLNLLRDSDSFPTDKLKGVEKLYILAGLGGVTGSKFAEIAAKSAKSDGVGNVALIVTLPFIFEGTGKMANASEALKSLSDIPVKVLNNEDLTERYPDLNFIDAFEYSDKEALNAMESGLI